MTDEDDAADAPAGESGGSTNDWDGDDYDATAGFVAAYGESVVDLLDPRPGERVLDLGCGTGRLTAEIADAVGPEGTVVGLDSAPDMVATARESYPGLSFSCVDAREFSVADLDVAAFDAVFSNAALHWVPRADQRAVAERVVGSLAPGGRFVAELGGTGNVAAIVDAVQAQLRARGYEREHPWYFPTVGEHATLLEAAGLEVRLARLFDRPTELDGESGLADWLDVFGDSLLAGLDAEEREAVVAAVEDRLRGELYDAGAATWTADYRRLRFRAVLD